MSIVPDGAPTKKKTLRGLRHSDEQDSDISIGILEAVYFECELMFPLVQHFLHMRRLACQDLELVSCFHGRMYWFG